MNKVSFSLNMIKDTNFTFHDDEIDRCVERNLKRGCYVREQAYHNRVATFNKNADDVSKCGEIRRTFIAP